jgi:hypothetical protein
VSMGVGFPDMAWTEFGFRLKWVGGLLTSL